MPFVNPTRHGTDGQARRVLVVARDEDARSMLVFLLRAEGFNVFSLAEAGHARTLLRLCRGPVTIILDDSVPDSELLPWLQSLHPIPQVMGIVLRQRRRTPPARVAMWLARLPAVVVRQPLQIASLLGALAAIDAAAAQGTPKTAAHLGMPVSRTDSTSIRIVRPFRA